MIRRVRIAAARAALACALVWGLSSLPGAVPASVAQALDWADISGPWGFSGLYELGDGTLFAIDGNLLYRSFDGGATWENFPRPGGPILEFAARGSTTVLAIQRNAANFKQYFISTDRGNTWTRFATEGNPVHMSLMLSPEEIPHALYPVGSRLAVERFVNGFWERAGVPSGVYYAANVPQLWTLSAIDESGTFYIGTTTDGIHSSRDSGQSWTKALPYRYVSTIAFGPGGRSAIGTMPNGRTVGGVFVSGDRGAGWNVAGLTDLYMSGMTFNLAGDLLVLGSRSFSGPLGIYRLNAGSAAWDSGATFAMTSGTLHRTGAGKYIVTSPGYGMVVSADGGTQWLPDGVRYRDIFSLASAPDGSLLAGSLGDGVFRTTDDGVTWSIMAEDSAAPRSFYCFLTVETTLYAGTEKGLFTTPDDGVSWAPVLRDGFQPDTGYLSVYAIVQVPSGDLLVGTGAGIFRRREGVPVWEPAGLGASTVRGLALSPAGTVWAVTGAEGVYSSGDGGMSWSPRGLDRPDLQTVAVSGSGRIFVGCAGGVFFSTDGGAGWTQKIFTYGHVQSILFNGNFNIFAGTSDGLFVSSDAGQSWASAGIEGGFISSMVYDSRHALVAGLYQYGVAMSAGIITAVGQTPGIPAAPSLLQNYPNPFNPATTIAYAVPRRSRVTLTVYDVLGRISETLVSGELPPGEYRAAWDGSGRPSGVYFYALTIEPSASGPGARDAGPAIREVRKMLLLR